MKTVLISACSAAAFTLGATGAGAVTPRDKDIVDSCLMMSIDAMVNDNTCRDLMRRWNVTTADMVMVKACRQMAMDVVNKDADCIDVRKKHSDIVAAALQR